MRYTHEIYPCGNELTGAIFQKVSVMAWSKVHYVLFADNCSRWFADQSRVLSFGHRVVFVCYSQLVVLSTMKTETAKGWLFSHTSALSAAGLEPFGWQSAMASPFPGCSGGGGRRSWQGGTGSNSGQH